MPNCVSNNSRIQSCTNNNIDFDKPVINAKIEFSTKNISMHTMTTGIKRLTLFHNPHTQKSTKTPVSKKVK